MLNCYVADRSIASIVPGEVLGGRTATERLIRSGHRRIGLIQGEDWMDASRDRLKGYRQALEKDLQFCSTGNCSDRAIREPSTGFDQTIALMDLAHPPSAIFC